MNPNKQRLSMVFLILGIAFLAVGLGSDNKTFTWMAIAFTLIALVWSARWRRPMK